jgi:heat shock protein HslJ
MIRFCQLAGFAAACLSIACGSRSRSTGDAARSSTAVADSHTSRNSLDWAGTYQGVVPCPDCEGIETRLTLRSGEIYRLRTRHLGKGDSAVVVAGTFGWTNGSVVVLAGRPEAFQVVENAVIQLDRDRRRIVGPLAERYRLTKRIPPTEGQIAALVARRWVLVEVMGKPIPARPGPKEPHLVFDFAEERVAGTGGCNSFSGGFELGEGNRITFPGPLAATKMACPDMSTDQAMMDALARVDNWTIGSDTLSLNRARMAPLMRLVGRER